MTLTESSPCLKKSMLNLRLLPIKLHFFFSYGAVGGVVSFLPVLAKNLGINATAVGLIFTILPFIVMFFKPIMGMIADYFQNLKIVIIVIMIITSIGYFLLLFIPPLNLKEHIYYTDSSVNCEETRISPQNILNSSCLNITEVKNSHCLFKEYKNCSVFGKFRNILGICNSEILLDIKSILRDVGLKDVKNNSSSCKCNNFTTFFDVTSSCFLNKNRENTKSSYKSFQFWIFALLTIIGGSCSASLYSLSDTFCYEVIDDPRLYGKQRLWATISWGIITLLTGYLNDNPFFDIFGLGSYSSGFYLMLILMSIDLIILTKITVTKTKFSYNFWKDINHIFVSQETIVFVVGIYIMGALTALLWQYQFWFLQDIGASQLLLGLTIAVQCLIGEVPCFFLSGKIITYFGHMNCLIITFAVFALRYGLYSILINPWLVLPIEVLHGQTFGVFYAAMTSYANSKAIPGTEATMIGVFGGIFEGLGLATGSLLGGVGIDKLNGRQTFLIASVLSAICFVCFSLIKCIFKTRWTSVNITKIEK